MLTAQRTCREASPIATSIFARTTRIGGAKAPLEVQRISERTKVVLARAPAQEKTLGRPTLPDSKRAKLEKLRGADLKRFIRSITKAAGVA